MKIHELKFFEPIRDPSQLVEERGDLYHITTLNAWKSIKSSDTLSSSQADIAKNGVKLKYNEGKLKSYTKQGKEYQVADWKLGDFLPIIRRVVYVARRVDPSAAHMSGRSGPYVVITLDANKLRAAGYKIQPKLGDYGRSSEQHYTRGRRENEEVIYKGDDFVGITSLSKFIRSVQQVQNDGSLKMIS